MSHTYVEGQHWISGHVYVHHICCLLEFNNFEVKKSFNSEHAKRHSKHTALAPPFFSWFTVFIKQVWILGPHSKALL